MKNPGIEAKMTYCAPLRRSWRKKNYKTEEIVGTEKELVKNASMVAAHNEVDSKN